MIRAPAGPSPRPTRDVVVCRALSVLVLLSMTARAQAQDAALVLFAEAELGAEHADAVALELGAASLRLDLRGAGAPDEPRRLACAGARVIVLAPSDPPTAPPLATRIECDPHHDRELGLSLPLDTIAPRALAIALVDLATSAPPADEPRTAPEAQPVAGELPADPAASIASHPGEPRVTQPPHEVVVRRARDWTGHVFLRVGAIGSIDLSIVSPLGGVQDLMTGAGAGIVGVGWTATRLFRPTATLRAGASGRRSFEAQLSLAPELLFPIREGSISLAPALVLGFLEGPALGGAIDLGFESALGPDSPLRGWATLRFAALAIDTQPPLLSLGLSVGVDVTP